MVSSVDEGLSVEDRILSAAASCVIDFGIKRVSIAEVARRAGVSRPTIYRRWSDSTTLLASVVTHRIVLATREIEAKYDDPNLNGRELLVLRIVEAVRMLKDDKVLRAMIDNRPELANVYISHRLGESQLITLDENADAIAAGQLDRSIRTGDTKQMAAMLLLITQVMIYSAPIVQGILDTESLTTELTRVLNGYLAP